MVRKKNSEPETVQVAWMNPEQAMILLQKHRDQIMTAQTSEEKVDLASLLVDGHKVVLEALLSMIGTQLSQAQAFKDAMTGVRAPSPADLARMRGMKGIQ